MASDADNASTGSTGTRRIIWLRWMPFGILLIAAVILLVKWPSLPDRWVIHWGPGGEPDGWATRTPLMVFLPLLAGGLICGFLELLATVIIKRPRVRSGLTSSPEAATRMAAVTGEIVRMISLFVALLFAIIAVALPLLRPETPMLIIVAGLVIALVPTGIGLVRLKRTASQLKSQGQNKGADGWNGIIYRNQADARLMVPKGFSPGYTINYGNRWAWPITILLLAILLLAVLVMARVI